MTDNVNPSNEPADDMSEYLQTFLDETDEQLDDLVETMLELEQDVSNEGSLNEAFRLIHSIKGSAGMMGFNNITVLTHHLENRFERFRSGVETLDEPTMNLVLRCIDFLRQCNVRLRDGEQLGGAAELLGELKELESQAQATEANSENAAVANEDTESNPPLESKTPDTDDVAFVDGVIKMVIRFRAGLQLADLKAQLILSRVAGFGEVRSTNPLIELLPEAEDLEQFEIQIEFDGDVETLRGAADVDGVESIEFGAANSVASLEPSSSENLAMEDVVPGREATGDAVAEHEAGVATGSRTVEPEPVEPEPIEQEPIEQESVEQKSVERGSNVDDGAKAASAPQQELTSAPRAASEPKTTAEESAAAKVAETMRVDIDRLDNLMNLAGELVVNRARFVQISDRIDPALRKAAMENRVRDFSDGLRRTIEGLQEGGMQGGNGARTADIGQLQAGLELLEEQATIWENGRQCLGEMSEAIDQLARVSHSLQRGVLDTRMVPVAPLFNRFKRVVRDLSKERGKQVDLVIRGEKTELDKRMIDELGDPLVHLVRNSIDHGLESPDIRTSRGKSEVGTISLEATHSGNNVFIRISDDGGGIDVEKIKSRLIHNGVLSESAARGLNDSEAMEYIWHPGFSTAKEVTDVSGRGVGMDVVKTRIGLLNGTIEVDSTLEQGTTFALRLPLTLAIIDCLLVRLHQVVFSLPIDDVREIVSVSRDDIRTVQGKQTIEIRDEFLPLVSIENVFHWHDVDYGHGRNSVESAESGTVDVVILSAAGKTIGLLVDELLGSQDIVIKSLSDNFMNIRGLSGASILGDGSVCLMLDVGRMVDMAVRSTRTGVEETAL